MEVIRRMEVIGRMERRGGWKERNGCPLSDLVTGQRSWFSHILLS
jgi:hypothetical protein